MGNIPSTAAQIMITIIPIVGIVTGGIVIFFFLLWSYRQKIRMIEKGIRPGGNFDLQTFALLTGLLTFILGILLFFFFLFMEGVSYSLLGGLVPLSIGISFLLFFMIKRKQDQ